MKGQILDFLDFVSDEQHELVYKQYTQRIKDFQENYDKIYEINTRFEDLQDLNQNQGDIILPEAISLPESIVYVPQDIEIDWKTLRPGKLVVFIKESRVKQELQMAIVKRIFFGQNATNEEIVASLSSIQQQTEQNLLITTSQQFPQNTLKNVDLNELRKNQETQDDKLLFEIVPLIHQEKQEKNIQFLSLESKSNRISPFMQKLGTEREVIVNTKQLFLPLDIFEDGYIYQFKKDQQCLYYNKNLQKWQIGIVKEQGNRQNRCHFKVQDYKNQSNTYTIFSRFILPCNSKKLDL